MTIYGGSNIIRNLWSSSCDDSITQDFPLRDSLKEIDITCNPFSNIWGPYPITYSSPLIPKFCDPIKWQHKRILAVINKIVAKDYNYCHHHSPIWTPSQPQSKIEICNNNTNNNNNLSENCSNKSVNSELFVNLQNQFDNKKNNVSKNESFLKIEKKSISNLMIENINEKIKNGTFKKMITNYNKFKNISENISPNNKIRIIELNFSSANTSKKIEIINSNESHKDNNLIIIQEIKEKSTSKNNEYNNSNILNGVCSTRSKDQPNHFNGLDCTNYISYLYNYAFGINIVSDVNIQSCGAESPGKTLNYTLNHQHLFLPGDILYITGAEETKFKKITHAVIWTGIQMDYGNGTFSFSNLIKNVSPCQQKSAINEILKKKMEDVPVYVISDSHYLGPNYRPFAGWYTMEFSHVRRIINVDHRLPQNPTNAIYNGTTCINYRE